MRKRVIDLSKWNKKWNFEKAKAAGIDGAILKASQGLMTDSYFLENRPNLIEQRLDDGAYHYFTPSKPAAEQAEKFYSLIKDMPLKIGAWLDLEYNAKVDGASEHPAKFRDYGLRVLSFLVNLEDLGIRAGIYTNPSHSYAYLSGYQILASYDLWLANPQTGQTRTVPNCPIPFFADSWRGWQFTWKLPNPAYYGAPADSIKGLDGNIFRW